MSFHLKFLENSDIPQCVTIYFAAFTNPHSLGCWPRTDPVRKWWEASISDELHDSGAHWLKAVTPEGELAGFAKWIEPRPGIEPETELPEWPEGADLRLCDETFSVWFGMHKELFGKRGHWYLEMIAVAPAFQGRGAGSLMLDWGSTRADQTSHEAYLEASPDAVSVYERFGFREAGRTDTWIENERVKGVWYRNLFMIRPAQPPKTSC